MTAPEPVHVRTIRVEAVRLVANDAAELTALAARDHDVRASG